jgi:hypothetical protein
MLYALFAAALVLIPPDVKRRNDAAVAHHRAGRDEAAITEFLAAYATLDPRDDRELREQLLASVRGLLLVANERTGEAAPLCRLQRLLADHGAALAGAYPDPPPPVEVEHNQAMLERVAGQLAAFPADVCDAPAGGTPPTAPPTAGGTAPTAGGTAPTAAPEREVPRPGRPAAPGPTPTALRIAGVTSLGIGAVLLGMASAGIAREQRHRADARALDEDIAGRPIAPDEHAALVDHLTRARGAVHLAVGTGVAAAASVGLGAALLVLARKQAQRRVAVSPWWLSSGTGLMLSVRLP